MHTLKLSVLFRKQIKKIAKKSQPMFLDICEQWEFVHTRVSKLNSSIFPLSKFRITVKIKRRPLYLIYRCDMIKKQIWVECVLVKVPYKNKFKTYIP